MIAIVPAVRLPVPVDVTDGVAVTVAVPGAMPRTSPASETVKTLVLDESKITSLICDGSSGFDAVGKLQGHSELDNLTHTHGGWSCYFCGDIAAVHFETTCNEADKCQRNDKRTCPPWLGFRRA